MVGSNLKENYKNLHFFFILKFIHESYGSRWKYKNNFFLKYLALSTNKSICGSRRRPAVVSELILKLSNFSDFAILFKHFNQIK